MRHGHRSKAGEGKQGRSNCWNNFIMLSHGILMHFTLMSGYVNRDDSYYLTAIFKSVDGIITGTNIQITGLKGSFFFAPYIVSRYVSWEYYFCNTIHYCDHC